MQSRVRSEYKEVSFIVFLKVVTGPKRKFKLLPGISNNVFGVTKSKITSDSVGLQSTL